ncbi:MULTISPECIES: hypothetical protein [unclassified Devosia]|uniref:hypothetical protein n=1 Tax=unclassified Devosia TaxID=196773 RepID=UPI0008690804|nr:MULTISPECIES: hypothetical protein [unclassified Devosia]MBN9360902.1 hypothetical protein [Devosia sp.]ODS88124.1 MAG: hypothetical protein ABS47_10225 [Devosia sp. SCN 66-27]OJX22847.1 MAG: hypothetical protein BGO83_18925 [Devosia sp. 66-14]
MSYELSLPADHAGNPKHIFLNLTDIDPQYYHHYYLQGTDRHLHVAEMAGWPFESLMKVGKHLQYAHESEIEFSKVVVDFNRARRRWTIGELDDGDRAVYCRLPYGHGFLMKL